MGATRNAAGRFVKADASTTVAPALQSAAPAVGDVVDFDWTDPLLGATTRRRGVVTEVGTEFVCVAPLADYALSVLPSQIG